MLHARISGIASYVPDDILDNGMLSEMVDTNDEWITTRVGIKERRILRKEGAGSSYMGAKAVERLLERTGVNPDDIEMLICATSNPDYRFPSTASVMIEMCHLSNCYGYDIQAACAGFIVALEDANAYIRSGLRKKILIVCTEKMSSMVNYKDRATCPLFGDGAAAVLVEPADEVTGVIDTELHVDGRGRDHLLMRAGGSVLPTTHATVDAGDNYLFQDGRNVYKNAVTDMYTSSVSLMKRNNLSVDDVDYLIPHQANLRIIEAVSSRAGFPREKVLVNIEHYGNTSAASIPICLDEFYSDGTITKGSRLLLTAFGAGYTWGAMYLIWDI